LGLLPKTFLNVDEKDEAIKRLLPVHFVPGKILKLRPDTGHQFSDWLGQKLLENLESFSAWEGACPIALGSWARYELCPR